jgi:hypothetical protein
MPIAKIENATVVQIDRTTDTAPDGWVSCGANVACGMLWDGEGFSDPPPTQLPQASSWDALTFLERFSQAERIAIRQAASGASADALELADWLDMLRVAKNVSAADPRTEAGMAALVAAGLLSAERRDEILGIA